MSPRAAAPGAAVELDPVLHAATHLRPASGGRVAFDAYRAALRALLDPHRPGGTP
ncbi:hypothetical protein [Kineococcus esterisolvens]|uniref:hypothetical protein n=1 Tax=unclassified Kineococcus TaxID=2621656 RepID=UPI003D7D808E